MMEGLQYELGVCLRDMSVYLRNQKVRTSSKDSGETLSKCVDCSCSIFLLYEHML